MEYISGEIKQVGPETAANMLQHVNEEFQRTLVDAHVKHLASIMDRGEFFTGHVVIANVAGEKRIANGQHTLNAIEMCGTPVRCVIERYKCEDNGEYLKLFHAFDTENRKRTYLDSAKAFLMSGEVEIAGANPTLLNLFRSGLEYLGRITVSRRFVGNQTRYERFDHTVKQDGEFSLFCELDSKKDGVELLYRAPIIAAIIATHRLAPDLAKDFWSQVVSGWFECKSGNKNYPTAMLNKFLRTHSLSWSKGNSHNGQQPVTRGEVYTTSIRCWNAFMRGDDIKKLYGGTKNNKPVVILSRQSVLHG